MSSRVVWEAPVKTECYLKDCWPCTTADRLRVLEVENENGLAWQMCHSLSQARLATFSLDWSVGF